VMQWRPFLENHRARKCMRCGNEPMSFSAEICINVNSKQALDEAADGFADIAPAVRHHKIARVGQI
jgi:hypothetical protein